MSKRNALICGSLLFVLILIASWMQPWCLLALPLCAVLYWWMQRKTKRRIHVLSKPFPNQWETILQSRVEYFRALDDTAKERFRKMVSVFLDEMPITGIRTEVDEVTRVLVAASAVIPVFGFDDWEYGRLGEVLIYPGRFGENFELDENADRRTLGMIGIKHLSGVMILSKPDLINGFDNTTDKRNVGIHEFSHLVDLADGSVDGLPPGIPGDVVKPWINWVSRELESPRNHNHHIDDYAYTNQAEYFAVLTEYFFESPELLQQKNPKIYQALSRMYHQDTRSLLSSIKSTKRKRIGRNSKCPCGSGKKYKRCCRKR